MEVVVHIVQVSSEIVPWSKVGGLGDVSGALPSALAARSHRVITVAPRYRADPEQRDTGWRTQVWLGGVVHDLAWFALERAGVLHLFVDHVSYRREGIYGDEFGAYGDNLLRFALLCRAALQLIDLPIPGGPLADDVVWHCNDWHAGLLPVYLDAVYRPVGRQLRASTVLAIHNAGHFGQEGAEQFGILDLSPRWWSTCDFDGALNPLKAGVVSADQLVTVSPTYARELTADGAGGLQALLVQRAPLFRGIVNGVGPEWDPRTDMRLPARYSAADRRGKADCKSVLQEHFGLQLRSDIPLIAFVGRLVPQKGVDLLRSVADRLIDEDVQLVLLGTGQRELEDWLRAAPGLRPGWWGSHVGYSEDLAHLIEAGADMFVMPSRFEPCGLNQLYSMRYGTLPIVHAVGGLADTVEPIDEDSTVGTGFRFDEPTIDAFEVAVRAALRLYRRAEHWNAAVDRAMAADWSWAEAAASYEAVYLLAQASRSAGDAQV
ncbi:MAG: starch synthase [Kiritimatiellia bacterium]